MALYADPNIPAQSVFDTLGILEKEIESFVPLTEAYWMMGYSKPVIDKLSEHFGSIPQVDSKNRVYTTYKQSDFYPSATITSRVAQGTNLILGITPAFSGIQKNNMVFDGSGSAIGEAISIQSGFITVKFLANTNTNTSFASGDFAKGNKIIDGGDIGNVDQRETKDYTQPLPSPYKNIIGTIGQDVHLNHEDFFTYGYLKNMEGTNYYALLKETTALVTMYEWYVRRALYGNVPAIYSQAKPVGASVINQIITAGGGVPLTTAPDEAFLQTTIESFKARGGVRGDNLVWIVGDQFMAGVQKSLKPYVVTAGENNVLGGKEVKGLNIFLYAYQGLMHRFIIEPLFSNPNMWASANGFTTRSNTALVFSPDNVPTVQGTMMAPLRERYFGKKADIVRWETPGLYDTKGNQQTVGTSDKGGTAHYTWDKQHEVINPKAWLSIGTV